VLLEAAILSAPWRRPTSAGLSVAACGLVGAAYSLVVLRRARGQRDYVPVLEDWIWHVALPFVAYLGLLVGGLFLAADPPPWLFVIGAAALLLLFVGIHNAWDAVTYLAQRGRRPDPAGPA
jgi:phosphatidylglycerophosphate synthase